MVDGYLVPNTQTFGTQTFGAQTFGAKTFGTQTFGTQGTFLTCTSAIAMYIWVPNFQLELKGWGPIGRGPKGLRSKGWHFFNM